MVSEKQKSNLRVPSASEARERGKRGGRKRAENARAIKTLKETLLEQLDEKTESGKTVREECVKAIIKQARKGNTKAFEILRDTIGEKPKEAITVESNGIDSINIEFVDKSNPNNVLKTDPKIVGDYTPPTNLEE